MESKDPEAVFYMKPAAVIEALAREFVSNQIAMAQVRATAAELPDDPRAAQVRARAAEVQELWVREGLPNLAASFRLALEVLDTFGPQGVDVEDGIDAAIWNNKYFVWRQEFTPQ